MKTIGYALTFIFVIMVLCIVVLLPDNCKSINPDFRPHVVTHYHKSKTYLYNHNDACSCYSVEDDISGVGSPSYNRYDFVTYNDNGEIYK